ncbi:MAG: hypothetical protein FWD89_05190 [Firmicutes bacterium]|nr:hypothetical protein [Bacillota bacterium]
MSKRRVAIKRTIALSVICLIFTVFAVVPFAIPFTALKWSSFAGGIRLGADLNGGFYAMYSATLREGFGDAENEEFVSNEIDNTVDRVRDMLRGRGYQESRVTRVGDNIRVELPRIMEFGQRELSQPILHLIGTPAEIVMSDMSPFSEVDLNAPTTIRGFDIASASVIAAGATSWGVEIVFTDAGRVKFENLTRAIVEGPGSHVYIYANGEPFGRGGNNGMLGVDTVFTEGRVSISGGMTTRDDAENYIEQILAGRHAVQLEMIGGDNGIHVIDPLLGPNTIRNLLIAGGVIFVAVAAVLIVFYRRSGIFATLSLMTMLSFTFLLLNALPYAILTLSGVFGIFLAFIFAVDIAVLILERIRREVDYGKKLQNAISTGFRRTWARVVHSAVLMTVFGLIVTFAFRGPLRNFIDTFLPGMLFAVLIMLLLFRLFMFWQAKINQESLGVYGYSEETVETEKPQKKTKVVEKVEEEPKTEEGGEDA